jgi:hypothetical protein
MSLDGRLEGEMNHARTLLSAGAAPLPPALMAVVVAAASAACGPGERALASADPAAKFQLTVPIRDPAQAPTSPFSPMGDR